MPADNTAAGLSVLAACTCDVRLWCRTVCNSMLTSRMPWFVSSAVPSLTVSGVDLWVAEQMRVLRVVLDQRMTFEKHATAMAKWCIYHAQAIVWHLLTPNSAQTLACSLILSRIDYCNALLHGTPAVTIHKLQRVQNKAARIVLQAPRQSDAKPLLRRLHGCWSSRWSSTRWPVLTFKIGIPQHQPTATAT